MSFVRLLQFTSPAVSAVIKNREMSLVSAETFVQLGRSGPWDAFAVELFDIHAALCVSKKINPRHFKEKLSQNPKR